MFSRPRTGRRAALLLPALLVNARARPARAATLEIAPVLVELPPGRPSAVLNIINTGATPARLQIRAFTWVQENGQDRLQPTDVLLFSPPQFTLEPGQAQVARVALRRAPVGGGENAFRLLVDELPPPGGASGVSMLIRVSLPVFAAPAPGLAAVPDYAVLAGAQPVLVVRNGGNRRTVLAELRVGGAEARTDGPGYVLAGAERRWTLPASVRPRPGGTVRLTGFRDGEALDVAVPVRAG